ncbi:MAG: HNH endonuclease [Bacteroidales bacterium]|nr:HNH endonuclease [Bacteroidales bacterium]
MYSDIQIKRIWDEKGIVVDGYDKNLYRKDAAGAWIAFSMYGNRDSVLGWEVDHIFPKAKGGDDQIENLRPLNWRNNESKGDDYPMYKTAVVAENDKNIFREEERIVNEITQKKLQELYG